MSKTISNSFNSANKRGNQYKINHKIVSRSKIDSSLNLENERNEFKNDDELEINIHENLNRSYAGQENIMNEYSISDLKRNIKDKKNFEKKNSSVSSSQNNNSKISSTTRSNNFLSKK